MKPSDSKGLFGRWIVTAQSKRLRQGGEDGAGRERTGTAALIAWLHPTCLWEDETAGN